MPWLVRGEDVLAAAEVAVTRRQRREGLMRRDSLDGVLVLRPCRQVHSFGMRFPIDVAFCDRDLRVVAVVGMPRFRLGRPRLRARSVLEAEAGAFERWKLHVGDQLEVKG